MVMLNKKKLLEIHTEEFTDEMRSGIDVKISKGGERGSKMKQKWQRVCNC